MPIVQLPPPPPKKVSIRVRLEEEKFAALKRYAVFVGANNYSIIISQGLDKLHEIDNDYREWLELHPDFEAEKRPRRNGALKQARKVAVSGAPAPSIVAAAEAANVAEV